MKIKPLIALSITSVGIGLAMLLEGGSHFVVLKTDNMYAGQTTLTECGTDPQSVDDPCAQFNISKPDPFCVSKNDVGNKWRKCSGTGSKYAKTKKITTQRFAKSDGTAGCDCSGQQCVRPGNTTSSEYVPIVKAWSSHTSYPCYKEGSGSKPCPEAPKPQA